MSEKQLRRMIDHASAFCERHFASKGGVVPMWLVVTSSGESIIEPHPVCLGKDMAAALIRAWFDLHDVIRYVYFGEAWTLPRMIQREELEQIQRDGLAEHPERVEVLQLQAEDCDYGQIIASRDIIRPKHGRPTLGPLQMINDLPFIPQGAAVASEGRLVGMLPVRGTMQ